MSDVRVPMILETPASAEPIPRDRNGWPTVPDPTNPDQTLRCHRPSSLAKKYLTDTYAVDRWKLRTVIKGAGTRPDIATQAATLHLTDDRAELDRLAGEAATAGGADRAANQGTARHTLLHKHLTGQTVDIPPDLAEDYDAIVRLIDHHNIRLHGNWSERFVICHTIPAAGSPDAYVTLDGYDSIIVLDLKTGGDPTRYSRPVENAVQLAVYARTDICGPANNNYVVGAIVRADLIVAAWGANAGKLAPYGHPNPQAIVLEADLRPRTAHRSSTPKLAHLGLTKHCDPKHPLYVRADTRPTLFGA